MYNPSGPSRSGRSAVSRILISCVVLMVAVWGLSPVAVGGDDCVFVRGNVVDYSREGVVDLNDGVDILAYLFLGVSVPACQDAADVNDNGVVELSDYTYLVNFLFNGGPPPPAPYPDPGLDPTPDVSVGDPDPRFHFSIGSGAGVPGMTGIQFPVTLSNEVEITGLQMLLRYNTRDETCPDLLIHELRTEENTLLSGQSAEYIVANFDNVSGVAYIAALKDFATPFSFQSGEDPNLPPGEDQLIATVVLGIASCADMGVATIGFADDVRIRIGSPPVSNFVMLGDAPVRPTLGDPGTVEIRRGFIRGDANKDDAVDIGDPVWLLEHIFRGGPPPPCLDAADANNDTRLDLSDPIWILNFLFQGGPQPSEPFPQAGVDPSDDGGGSLGCASDG